MKLAGLHFAATVVAVALLAAAPANQTGSAVATESPLSVLQESRVQYEPPQFPDWYSIHGVRRPVVISKVEAEYTPEARERKVMGEVVLAMWVDTNGRPGRLKVLRSLEPGLDAKAIEAARKWRFKPALKGGKPVPAPVTIQFGFRLQ
jgi:TonB family protein